MKKIVIMPGGFHPFHAGHYALYKSALEAFPDADVYVAATNDQKERPFPFSIKEKLAKLAGVQSGRFVQVKSPFKSEEITSHYNPNEDVLIFVRSEKDKTEQPKPGGTKKDGNPAYFQPWTGKNLQPFSRHAYIAYLPTVTFGPGIQSATEIRKAWPTLDDRRKTAMVMSLYPATQKNPKLAQNVVQLLDVGMGGQQGMAEGAGFDKWADDRAASQLHKLKPATTWEVSYDYGPHMSKSVTVKASSEEEAVAKVEKAAEKRGLNIMINSVTPAEQGVAEGSDGWIGNPAKWKEAVHQAHGPDVVFKNYSHPGQPGKRSVNAINAAGKQVGVYQRHNKMGMVQPNQQGVAEGAPIVVMPRADRLKKPEPTKVRYQGDIVPSTKPPSTEKRGVKGRPGQRPMPEQGVAEGASLSVEQLAHISDKALDDAYHYGRSTPGANFGWMANIQSAKAAKRLIDAGETDIEVISDAIHKGWNVTAAADYKGQLQLDTPTPEDKKLKRAKLAMKSYSDLPEEEKEKDRVVARALLQAIKGKQSNISESSDYLDEK